LLAYSVIHLLLFLFDLSDPAAILRGDRADGRLSLAKEFLSAGGEARINLLRSAGAPGDYLVQALGLVLGGEYALILLQVACGVVSIVAVVGIGINVGASRRVSSRAALFLCFMPGSLLSPHVAVTESAFTAALTSALWSLSEAIRTGRALHSWLGMLLLLAASIIRPQAMLYPWLAAGLLHFLAPKIRVHSWAGALASSAVFPGIWMLWRYVDGNGFGMGASSFDLEVNWYIRAARIQDLMSEGAAHSDLTAGRLSTAAFIKLASAYPFAMAKTYLSDLLNYALNPGANALFGIYLRFFETSADVFHWKRQLDTVGVLGVITEILRSNGRLLLAFAATAIVHAIALAGLIVGVICKLADPRARRVALLLISFLLMHSGMNFAAGIVRWTHRVPVEPVIAVFASVGIAWLLGHAARRISKRPAPVYA